MVFTWYLHGIYMDTATISVLVSDRQINAQVSLFTKYSSPILIL